MHPDAPAPHKMSVLLRLTPHVLLGSVVVGTLVRLAQVSSELCWSIAPPIVLLTVGYAAGLALWDRTPIRVRHLWLGLLVLLWCWASWVLPAPLASGYAWLAVPLAILAMRMFKGGSAVAAVGLVTAILVVCLVRVAGGARLDLLAPPAAAVWAAVALYRAQQRLVYQLGQARDDLARQQREAGRLAERARIARDLHDSLAQELAGSRMLLQAAERDWYRRPEAARRQVRAAGRALGASLADTRSIISDLTPPALEHDDLTVALHELCTREGVGTATPAVIFRSRGEPRQIRSDRAVALLRVVQGLLANAYEHACAAHIWVTLDHRNDTIAVEVRDDGVGFDAASRGTPSPDASGRGHGLDAVRERLAEHGGRCVVDSEPGRGTRVLASLPAQVSVMAATR